MSATIAARGPRADILHAPAVKRPAGARSRPKKRSWLASWLMAFARRPGRALVLLAFTAAAAAILLNATVFQRGRHPAPILSQPQAAPAAPRRAERPADPAPALQAPSQAAAPAQPQRSQPRAVDPAVQSAPKPPQPVTQAAKVQTQPQPAPVQQARSAPRDPIADLINGDLRPPAEVKARR